MKLRVLSVRFLPMGKVDVYVCKNIETGKNCYLDPFSFNLIERCNQITHLCIDDIIEIPDDTEPWRPTYFPEIMWVNEKEVS